MTLQPIWISGDAPPDAFPDVDFALTVPNGLLAIGGDLGSERLLCAYRRGIFPWYSDDQPILWWAPDPRAVLFPAELRVSRSLAKSLRNRGYTVSRDAAFERVVRACAAPRAQHPGTWITDDMLGAYKALHAQGAASSFEVWREGDLVGGLYGVHIGAVFFGESMFSRARDASKVALVHLVRAGFELIDCQLPSTHLASVGALLVPRARFVRLLAELCERQPRVGADES
jgi:leucyl/phenylalanyl-tRNA--protein transferase